MNRLAVYAGLYTASAALLKVASFVFFLWLARSLSVDEYATWGLLYALQTGITTLGLVGVIEAVVGLLNTHRSTTEQTRLFAAATGAFLTAVCVSMLVGLLVFFFFLGTAHVNLTTAASVLLSGGLASYASFQAQIVRLQERHGSSILFNFAVPLAGLLGSVVAFLIEPTTQSFFGGSVVGLSVSLIALRLKRIGFYGVSRLAAEIQPVARRMGPFVAVAFLGWLSGYGNNYVVALLFGAKEVAMFTFALSISSILQLILSALNQVWSPRFFRITHREPFSEVEKQNRAYFGLQSIFVGAFGALVIVIFRPLTKFFGGNLEIYAAMTPEIFLLFAAHVVLSPWWHCQNYFLAYDKGASVMRVVLATSFVGVTTWLALMWLLGPIGIYFGFLLQMLIRSLGMWVAARRCWPVQVSWIGVMGGVLLASIGFAASTMQKV